MTTATSSKIDGFAVYDRSDRGFHKRQAESIWLCPKKADARVKQLQEEYGLEGRQRSVVFYDRIEINT